MTMLNNALPLIRVRILPRFPAVVIGADGIKVEREAGVYTIAPAVDQLAEIASVPTTGFVSVWDEQSGVYSRIPASAFVGGGGAVSSVNGKTGTVVLTASDISGVGDMTAAVYDPTSKAADAFDMTNMVEGTTAKIFSATERTKLSGIASGATANTGTVTSVAMTVPTGLSVSGSPVTTIGTLGLTWTAGYQGYTSTEATKLSGIASGATANSSDATLLARANHTGTQPYTTITGLGTLATISYPGGTTNFLRADGTFAAPPGGGSGGGDMYAAVYDPNGVADDAFDMDNMAEGTTSKILTAAERTKLAGIEALADVTDATNVAAAGAFMKSVDDSDDLTEGVTKLLMTAAERSKLAGVAAGATANSADATLLARANHTGTQSADTITDGTTNKAFLATERTKLSGIANAATANDTDANLRNRANHTGTQSADTVVNGTANKVFTAAEQTKLAQQSGVNTGDQTITLTGDVVGSGTGSFSTVVNSKPLALRQIATHGLAPNGQHGTAKQIMSRTQHFARDNISALSLVYSNWFINNASGETASGGIATVTASIEYPAGTFTQVKFGGSTSTAIASGGTGTSDSVAVQIPDGAAFWVRTFATQAGSGLSLYQSPINTAGGSAAEVAASGLTDKTMSGTITDGGGNLAFGPTAVLGMTNRSSVLILGASNTSGTGDTWDTTGFIGLSDRSIGPGMAFIKSARPSEKALDLVNAHTNRAALAAYCTDVVLQLGTNDLNNGATAATLISRIDAIVGYFPGVPVYLCTVPPISSSTDSFATTGNQTALYNAERSAYNNAVRAKTVSSSSAGFFDVSTPLEPSLNAGIWRAPGYTTDGLHGTKRANDAVRDSRVMDPSAMGGALEAPPRQATPSDVYAATAHDLFVTPQSLKGNVPFLDGGNLFRNTDVGPYFTTYSDNAGVAAIVTRRARGTYDAPSAVLSGDAIGGIWARGYGATDFAGTGRGSVMFYATQNWTDAAHGTASEFATTANGSTSRSRTLYLDQDGSVTFNRIGTTASAANAYLDSAASNKLLRSTSSALYKTSVEDISPERADAVLNLRPVWYRSVAPADRADWSWYGLIAEEVAEIEPRLVHWSYREDDYESVVTGEDEAGGPVYGLQLKANAKLAPDGVQYERLTVMLLDIIKRQDQRIAALEKALKP